MTKNYPIVIHKDKDSDYGVTVPDLPGCFTAGGTIDEAIAMAREAIELHLEGLIEAGEVVPESQAIEKHQQNPGFKGGTWAVVAIDPASLRVAAKRINITLPERILDAVDQVAKDEGETRSGLLAKIATVYVNKKRRQSAGRKQPKWKQSSAAETH